MGVRNEVHKRNRPTANGYFDKAIGIMADFLKVSREELVKMGVERTG